MASRLNRLTARSVASLTKPGRHADGGGLYLLVKASGAKSWVFMWMRAGRQREMGLGSIDSVPLVRAREKARDARQELADGRDPLAARDKAKAKTFGEAADAYVDDMKSQWKNEKHAEQWRMTLTEYAAPLRAKIVSDIDTADVLDALKPIWTEKPETASRVRGRIEAVLDAAKASGLRTGENPARWRGHLDQLLPKRQRLSRGHHAALPYKVLPAFMADLASRDGTSARALEFTILTAARSGETRKATWAEFDLDTGIWTVPAARMKAGREHRVPLSARAVEILGQMKGDNQDGYVFPGGKPGSTLSETSLDMLLRRMKQDVTTHGFRSSFRDWASETTSFPHEVCEMALAHTIANKAEAAYRRGDLFAKRRELMDSWAVFCMSSSSRQSDGA